MAEKKKTTKPPKSKLEKPPTRRERITDFSTDSHVGPVIWGTARGKKK